MPVGGTRTASNVGQEVQEEAVIIDNTFPEDRKSLVEKLMNDGARPFVEVLTDHLNRLALVVPAVDDDLEKSGTKSVRN
jgi:hypothetical protein